MNQLDILELKDVIPEIKILAGWAHYQNGVDRAVNHRSRESIQFEEQK